MSYRFDIHMQALPVDEQVATFKFMSFGFNPTIAVKGFQFLINKWLKFLLTPRGSDPTDLEYGTDFTKIIGSNLALQDARDVALISILTCNAYLTRSDANDNTLTGSEKLASAEIVKFVEAPDSPGFDVYVEIKNQSNERLVLNLPGTALTET